MTRLYEARTTAGRWITQNEVATAAGINLRTYEALEQGTRDINRCAAMTVFQLAIGLSNLTGRKYTVEDLMEYQRPKAKD